MVGNEFLNKIKILSLESGAASESAKKLNLFFEQSSKEVIERIKDADSILTSSDRIKIQALQEQDINARILKNGKGENKKFKAQLDKLKGEKSFKVWLETQSKLIDDPARKFAAKEVLNWIKNSVPKKDQKDIFEKGDLAEFVKSISKSNTTAADAISVLKEVTNAVIDKFEPRKNFLEYLADCGGEGDINANALRQVLTASSLKPKIITNDFKLNDIMEVLDTYKPVDFRGPAKSILISTATELLGHYNAYRQGLKAPKSQVLRKAGIHLANWAQKLTIISIVLTAGAVIVYGFWNLGHLTLLANLDVARGFITLLFAVGALAIFMIITTAIVFDVNSDSKSIYERAKTILSMLIGIFGTVLGFYYGSQDDATDKAGFLLRPIVVEAGESKSELNITASVEGGEPDYKFFVVVTDKDGKTIENLSRNQTNKNGILNLASPLNVTLQAGKTIIVSVTTIDAKGASATSKNITYPVPNK